MMMRLIGLHTLIKQCLPTGMSIASLAKQAGLSRPTLYRRLGAAPWERNRGSHNEDRFFTRLATVLEEPKDKLLWFAGYNPFVGDLSSRQLYLVYVLLKKLIHTIQEGSFTGDLQRLARLTLQDLAEQEGDA